jgi:hypothetical protein
MRIDIHSNAEVQEEFLVLHTQDEDLIERVLWALNLTESDLFWESRPGLTVGTFEGVLK